MSSLHSLPDWVAKHRDIMVQDLTDYVSVETPSDDKILLNKGLEWIQGWLRRRLGEPTRRRLVDGGEIGDIAILDYAADDDGPWVTALCHYDTVWSAGTITEWPASVDGDRFTGPGAFDMKGGLIQLVWALKAATSLGLPRPNVRLVLNGDEEIGSPVSRPVIEEEVVRGSSVLVFEASAHGSLKTARKGVGIFQVQVRGEEAHAGLDPESGVSAIEEISRIVLELHRAADLEAGTTLNVGLLKGGTRTNVKAGLAIANIDVRVSSQQEAQRIDDVLSGLKPNDDRASLDVTGGWNRPVMPRSEGTARLFAEARAVAQELGFSLEETSVGGASDGNFVAALDLPVLDGLGAVGDGAHARSEWISINGMLERTCLAAGLLSRLSASAGESYALNKAGRS